MAASAVRPDLLAQAKGHPPMRLGLPIGPTWSLTLGPGLSSISLPRHVAMATPEDCPRTAASEFAERRGFA
jgi:hypothetical protein